MIAGHTKGPWTFLVVNDDPDFSHEINAGNAPVANVYADDIGSDADARLIAAAPDLFAALKGLCSWETELTQDKWDEARAAIAKATGQ